MVKAIKKQESGGGMFVNPSIGIAIQSTIDLQILTSSVQSAKISPNPTTSFCVIESSNTIAQLALFSVEGKRMMSISGLHKMKLEIDLSRYTSGFYFVKIEYENGCSETIKVSKL